MISFSGCKINLGLNIVSRRTDGFHDLESLFYPVRGLCDIVEVQKSSAGEVEFSSSGIVIDCPAEKNLCVRAFELMRARFGLREGARIHLRKKVPMGAGLGGGSANATAVLKIVNDLWQLGADDAALENLAAELGSDTAFFVRDVPAIATGKGEILQPYQVDLSGYYLLLVKPDAAISTPWAYSQITPGLWDVPLHEVVKLPVDRWKELLKNDFEEPIFNKFPELREIKQKLYSAGAAYASMSGSGSALYGLFGQRPEVDFDYFAYTEKIK